MRLVHGARGSRGSPGAEGTARRLATSRRGDAARRCCRVDANRRGVGGAKPPPRRRGAGAGRDDLFLRAVTAWNAGRTGALWKSRSSGYSPNAASTVASRCNWTCSPARPRRGCSSADEAARQRHERSGSIAVDRPCIAAATDGPSADNGDEVNQSACVERWLLHRSHKCSHVWRGRRAGRAADEAQQRADGADDRARGGVLGGERKIDPLPPVFACAAASHPWQCAFSFFWEFSRSFWPMSRHTTAGSRVGEGPVRDKKAMVVAPNPPRRCNRERSSRYQTARPKMSECGVICSAMSRS